jgi:pyruvate-ferredoxin/flavodoxin oxidoreductase
VTVSHLRFGPKPIRSTYLVDRANFVACHQWAFIDRLDMLSKAEEGATFLINSPHPAGELWNHLPGAVQKQIVSKRLRLFTIDAFAVAQKAGVGRRINTVMQTCFFALAKIVPVEDALTAIKDTVEKSYGKRGRAVVERNFAAIDQALANLHEVPVPAVATEASGMKPAVSPEAPEFVREVLGRILVGEGDELPVSALPPDGTFPTGTTQWEKRCISSTAPVWDPETCIQCGKCVLVCPHAVIRGKLYDPSALEGAPDGFVSTGSKWPDLKEMAYSLQVSVEDCTGCALCVEACPAKNKREAGRKAINMAPIAANLEADRANWSFFLGLPEFDRARVDTSRVKDLQLLEPLFEFSGACAGCGETPYVKLFSQLFGDRMIVANATGCSSIYGGNLPTTPWCKDRNGRGPAWSNSLFEDNAEFGFGMRVSLDKQTEYAGELLRRLSGEIGDVLVEALLSSPKTGEEAIGAQRLRVAELKRKLAKLESADARALLDIADVLVPRSVWILGGDGWAYDIGYGGLDHVLASGRNVNILVLDTEVYSNTGGQQSKATPRGAVAKFAAGGKPSAKKDLALLAMSYGTAYVARVAMGANDAQTLKAFAEADAWNGPSLILAYSHCIAHGYDLVHGLDQQKAAVQSGHWPLMRFNPQRAIEGLNPMQLDSKAPKIALKDYVYNETRYSMLKHSKPEAACELLEQAQQDVEARWRLYEHLAALGGSGNGAKN